MNPSIQRDPNGSSAGPLPIAVIGVGEHGRKHARAMKGLAGAQLAGVYDIRPDRCSEVATELGVQAFQNLDEALGAVRAASLVIPTTSHAEMALKAFARGVDVLVEKPITSTVAEADTLIAAAAAQGRILQVGHLERFNPGVVSAIEMTRSPMFFEIHRLGVFSPRSLDVDVVFDLMIHDLDLVLWMVQSRVREVRAVGLAVLTDKVDIANARVEFENGAVANLTASRVSTERVRKFRYFQPNEYISIDFTRRDAIVLSVDRGGESPQIMFRRLEGCDSGGNLGPPAGNLPAGSDPLRSELEAFVESVRTRRPPLVGGSEGRAALALAEEVMNCIEAHAKQLGVPLSRSIGQSGEV